MTLAPGHTLGAENGTSYALRILQAPNSGDELGFRTAFQHRAQDMSNRMFGPLSKILGGSAPTLNFVSSIPGGDAHASADVKGNAINLDPLVTEGLIDENAPAHSGSVNGIPHEMAHLRQTPQVLASVPDREGGAQAFADYEAPDAARAANTYYDTHLNFDGAYADYVKQAQARGLAWILAQQFGHPAAP